MHRKHRHRTMKGGFLENVSNTLSGWGASVSQGATNLWEKTKQATSSATSGLTGSTTSSYSPPMTTSSYGGRRRSRRYMRGGFKDNMPTTGLAAHAAPFSGQTARPHTWVGGKTKRRHRKGRKTRRH